MTLAVFLARHVAVLIAILAGAVGAGTLAFGPRQPLALRAALGMALWAEALFLLAAVNWLRPLPIVALTIIAVAGGVWRGGWRPRAAHAWALTLLPAMPLALHPPLAFDETLYHLPIVRSLAGTGGLGFLDALRFPLFPQFHELLCVPVYLLAGDAATHLVSLAQTLITTAVVGSWAAMHQRRAMPLAVALFIGSPIVVHLATILYVEAALTMFVTAGLYCLWRAESSVSSPSHETDAKRRADTPVCSSPHEIDAKRRADAPVCSSPSEQDPRALYVAAGLFLGVACSVKYLGGFFAVAALVILLASRRWRGALLFAAACALAALPTTIWLVAHSGNPLFPFMTSFFGASAWAIEPLPRAVPQEVLTVFWDATFARDRVNRQPPMTPFLIPVVLLIVAAATRDRFARVAAIILAAYIVVFAFLPRDSRYLVPLLPILAVAAAVIVARHAPRWTPLLAALACLPALAYLPWRLATMGPPPATAAERTRSLERRVEGYRALAIAGTGRVYVCGGEHLQAYAAGPLLGDFNGPHRYELVLESRDLAARLRALDVDYFLVVKKSCTRSVSELVPVYEDDGARLYSVPP